MTTININFPYTFHGYAGGGGVKVKFGFYFLLIPYLCFISLLYLDLYILGDDAMIS